MLKGGGMADLVGEYRHKLDVKGRLSLPSDFRKSLSKNLMVIQSPESSCLYVFEPEGFSAWVNALFEKDGGFTASNRIHVNQRKVLNSKAKGVEVDSAGRIGISSNQREVTGLDKDVVVIGDTDHFEIWDAKRWDEFVDSVDLTSLYAE